MQGLKQLFFIAYHLTAYKARYSAKQFKAILPYALSFNQAIASQ
jgi:hypothetical protein